MAAEKEKTKRCKQSGLSGEKFQEFLKRHDIISTFKVFGAMSPGLKDFVEQLEDIMYIAFVEGGRESYLGHVQRSHPEQYREAQKFVNSQRMDEYGRS